MAESVRHDKLVPPGIGREPGTDHIPHQSERGVQFVGDVIPHHQAGHGGLLVRDGHPRTQLFRWLFPGRGREWTVGECFFFC